MHPDTENLSDLIKIHLPEHIRIKEDSLIPKCINKHLWWVHPTATEYKTIENLPSLEEGLIRRYNN